MSRIGLTDRQWAFICPLLPPPARTGRPRADDRQTIEGILYILITRCRWQDLQRENGAPTTVWRRLQRWAGLLKLEQFAGDSADPAVISRLSAQTYGLLPF